MCWNRSRLIRLGGTLLWLWLLAGALNAADAYSRRWIWTAKEKKQIAKLAKTAKEEAQADYNGSTMYVLESDHWLVKTEVSPEFTAETDLFYELFYDLFMENFKFKSDLEVKRKPEVIVFNSEEKYQAQRQMPGSRGVFTWGSQGGEITLFAIYTYADGRQQANFEYMNHPVLQHEGTHCLVQRLIGTRHMPYWLNEGLATYYEAWDLRRNEKENQTMRNARSDAPEALNRYCIQNKGKFPPLGTLLDLTTMDKWWLENDKEATHFHYALAESFLDFLFRDKKRVKLLAEMVQRFLADKDILDEKEIAKLEPEWHKHLQKMRR